MIVLNPGCGIEFENIHIVIGEKKEKINKKVQDILGVCPYDLPKGSRENTSEIQDLGIFLIYENNILKAVEYACMDSFTISGFNNTKKTFREIYEEIKENDQYSLSEIDESIESVKLGIRIWINDIDDGDMYPPDSILIFKNN